MRLLSCCLLMAYSFVGTEMSAETSAVAGEWHGQSVCVTEASACRNETVVYYVSDIPDRPDVVTIRADKIVDGKAITMGTGEWHYDRSQPKLEWATSQQTWVLRINGSRIDGTLTLANGTLLRKMTLEKAK